MIAPVGSGVSVTLPTMMLARGPIPSHPRYSPVAGGGGSGRMLRTNSAIAAMSATGASSGPRSYRKTFTSAGARAAPGAGLDAGARLGDGTTWEGVHADNTNNATAASRSTSLLTHSPRDGSVRDLPRRCRLLLHLLLVRRDH